MRRMLMALLGSIIILVAVASSFAADCGDVNNSGAVNALDITYLINFLYKHGPAPNCGMVTDIDGNIYQTLKIGNQIWMVENLKVTHYRNGETIPNVTDSATWVGLTTGAYCEYDNDANNVATYGRLYNWYAVDDSRDIAPSGWHLPSDAEWKDLEIYLGMSLFEADAYGWRGTVEGGKLKEADLTHWFHPNTGATNESGFTALPGGHRYDGVYYSMGGAAFFWSSTDHAPWAWFRYLADTDAIAYRSQNDKPDGFSVRCVRD